MPGLQEQAVKGSDGLIRIPPPEWEAPLCGGAAGI
jgi:hypothetical protein